MQSPTDEEKLNRYEKARLQGLARQHKYFNRIREKGKVKCECGSELYVYHMREHLISIKHKQHINKLQGGPLTHLFATDITSTPISVE